MHEFLLQDPRRLQEVKWRMSCASAFDSRHDSLPQKGGRREGEREGEPDRHTCPVTEM